ncbi:MAG: EAL domain-containing protein [Alphaproteobacteria bacterium]|nr:EAL domain-containing protein [Alphaproteobacteria bacterium]
MGSIGHSAALLGAAAAAGLVGVAAVGGGWLDGVEATLAAGLLFALVALVLEIALRRRAETRTTHRILLLKRAHDRLARDLAVSRDEMRQLFELIEAEGGDEILDAIQAAADQAGVSRRDDGAAAAQGATAQGGADAGGDPDLESEVRVLHQLVEQLYADDASAGVRSRPNAPASTGGAGRREPRLGPGLATGPAAGPAGEERDRPPLRVVADDGPNRLSEERVLEIVRDGLRQDRVDLYLQPIVSLPQRKRRFFECFGRIRAEDGTVVTPEQYLEPARRAGLSTTVDNMMLFRCVQLLRKARRRDPTTAFFCNVSPHTLADREFLRDLIAYMENHRELASSLVFELAQADFDRQRERLAPDLQRIGEMGYRFSLDRVDRLDLDLDELESLNVHFLKIDAALILAALEDGGEAASQLRMLKQQLDARDIDLIVEKIETERMLVELLDFNIDFGQGYLFGEPRLSRDPDAASQNQRREPG